ncbi:MAG: formate/nitrite transporter family protein [Pirellulaceae bacterium]
MLAGLTFSLGLILVVVAGAELFTGNNLVVMAFASGKVSPKRFLLGWLVVYVGNFVGAFATAVLIHLTPYLRGGDRAVELNALNIAIAKCSIHPIAVSFGRALQCTGMSCRLVVFQLPNDDRQDSGDCSANRCVRCRRLRALRCQHVFRTTLAF